MQGKKISFTIHNFKFKYVRQKKTLTHHFLKTTANQNLKFGNSFY